MLLKDAEVIAAWVQAELAPTCERLVIAGSIRRRTPHPGDIEIVCEPVKAGPPVFGQKGPPPEPLTVKLAELCARAEHADTYLIPWGKDGQRYKCYMVRHPQGGCQLDLFISRPPMQWGWLLVLRTGPADFTHWLVTPQSAGGALPEGMKFDDGQLWRDADHPFTGGELVPTPTEEDVFAALGLAYRPPHQRLARWWSRKKVKA